MWSFFNCVFQGSTIFHGVVSPDRVKSPYSDGFLDFCSRNIILLSKTVHRVGLSFCWLCTVVEQPPPPPDLPSALILARICQREILYQTPTTATLNGGMAREKTIPIPTKGKVSLKNIFKFLQGGKEIHAFYIQDNHTKDSGRVHEGNTEEENNCHVVIKWNIH